MSVTTTLPAGTIVHLPGLGAYMLTGPGTEVREFVPGPIAGGPIESCRLRLVRKPGTESPTTAHVMPLVGPVMLRMRSATVDARLEERAMATLDLGGGAWADDVHVGEIDLAAALTVRIPEPVVVPGIGLLCGPFELPGHADVRLEEGKRYPSVTYRGKRVPYSSLRLSFRHPGIVRVECTLPGAKHCAEQDLLDLAAVFGVAR